METMKDLTERNRVLKNRITLIRFDVKTGKRTNTYSGISFPILISEIASSSMFNNLIYKMFIDLPYELDGPSELTEEWLNSVEKYELNLYL